MRSEQIRAARAMVRMEQTELAELAGVSVPTIKRIESMDGPIEGVRSSTLDAIAEAFRSRGVEMGEDDDGAFVRVVSADAILLAVRRKLKTYFPNTSNWKQPSKGSDKGFDFRGDLPDGRRVYIEVKGNKANMVDAAKQLASVRIDDPDATLVLIMKDAPFEGVTYGGVHVLRFPPSAEMDSSEGLSAIESGHFLGQWPVPFHVLRKRME